MIAYKGFRADMTCTLGKGSYQYEVGGTYMEKYARAARCGYHSAEYILDCMDYYPLGHKNRYCKVDISGSIDEDGSNSEIASTRMSILRELDTSQIIAAAMAYIILHPLRDWEKSGPYMDVHREKAQGMGPGSIAIARGEKPRVKGSEGSVMGLLLEDRPGYFKSAKIISAGFSVDPDTWYTLDANGNVMRWRG